MISELTVSELAHTPHLVEALKCILVNAIPVLLYAIWGSTLLEEIEEDQKDGNHEDRAKTHAHAKIPRAKVRPEDRETERATWLRQIQLVHAFTVLGQLLAFAICREAAPLPHGLDLIGFFVGLLFQSHVKFTLEKRVRGLEAAVREQTARGGRAFLLVFALFFAYLALVHGLGALCFKIAELYQVSPNAAAAARLAGSLGGVVIALFTAFALAPWCLRRVLPAKKLEDPNHATALRAHFESAGLTPPELWQLELERFGTHSALMVGIRWIRPALFVSRSLLRDFTPDEIRAVILHEISHVKLGHLRTRFWTTLGVLAGSCLLSTLLIVVAFMAFPKEILPLFAMPALLLPALAPYLVVRRQTRRQELAADLHAVFELGASGDALASALTRLDKLNGTDANFDDGTHPSTAIRIKQIHDEETRRNGPARVQQAA